jgi:hypothetical protein
LRRVSLFVRVRWWGRIFFRVDCSSGKRLKYNGDRIDWDIWTRVGRFWKWDKYYRLSSLYQQL